MDRLTWIEKTSWFRISAFNPSDYVRDRVKKGALVFVDGDASIDRYNDEATGKTLSALRIVQRIHPFFPFPIPHPSRLINPF